MSNFEWRLVGTDARQHAFVSDGGYLASTDVVSILSAEDGSGFEEIFGPHEVYVSECGLTVPVAMLLTAPIGEPVRRAVFVSDRCCRLLAQSRSSRDAKN